MESTLKQLPPVLILHLAVHGPPPDVLVPLVAGGHELERVVAPAAEEEFEGGLI